MTSAEGEGTTQGGSPSSRSSGEAHLVALHRKGKHTGAVLAALFNVARSTVQGAVERAGAAA